MSWDKWNLNPFTKAMMLINLPTRLLSSLRMPSLSTAHGISIRLKKSLEIGVCGKLLPLDDNIDLQELVDLSFACIAVNQGDPFLA